jgi:hypothetical protein
MHEGYERRERKAFLFRAFRRFRGLRPAYAGLRPACTGASWSKASHDMDGPAVLLSADPAAQFSK